MLHLHFVLLARIARIALSKKGFPYSLPSVGPVADPGVQAVSPQVTQLIHPAVGCHYFPPDLRLPSQPQSITAIWLVLILPPHGRLKAESTWDALHRCGLLLQMSSVFLIYLCVRHEGELCKIG